jgi:hypothetical protein
VLIESTDGARQWGTVGLSSNVVEASWQALVDSIEFKLHKDNVKPRIGRAAGSKTVNVNGAHIDGARPATRRVTKNAGVSAKP